MTEVTLEPEVGRFTLQMPLASHCGEITGVPKYFGRCDRVREADITSGDAILASEQGDTGRMTLCGVVEL